VPTPPPAPAPPAVLAPPGERAVFSSDDLDALVACYRANGFAVLRGLLDAPATDALVAEGVALQEQVTRGELSERYGTTRLVDDDGGVRTARFPNYVTHVTEIAPGLRAAVVGTAVQRVARAILGDGCWLLEGDPFGVVYQDARAGTGSSYSRIGWHSDWQSGPHLDRWPSVAFTVHLDATGPANGFLRVVPGSHDWATPAPRTDVHGVPVPAGSRPTGGYTTTPPPFPMPPGFENLPGEVGVYCERGDVLFHDAYLWHSAARATVDGAVRRHVRGGWYGGDAGQRVTEADFVKNAAR